jgi:hypothetical protein
MAADNYLTASDYATLLGDGVYAAVLEAIGADGVTSLAQQATSFVQGFMQNSGYVTPTLEQMVAENMPSLSLLKLAVAALLRELASSIPDISLPLPDNWDNHAGKRALEGILSGDMQLVGLTQNIGNAPGGWLMTTASSSERVCKAQRTSRKQLCGY